VGLVDGPVDEDGVAACAAEAVKMRGIGAGERNDVVMAPEDAYVDSWQSPFKSPFEIRWKRNLIWLLRRTRKCAG